jgi:hypothetical protein
VRDPKEFAAVYKCTAKDMSDLFGVSMSLAEKWLSSDRTASPYHKNAIELQDQQFRAMIAAEEHLQRITIAAEEHLQRIIASAETPLQDLRNHLAPAKLEFYDNWRGI